MMLEGGGDLFAPLKLLLMALTIGFGRYYGFTYVFPLFSWMEIRGTARFAIASGLSVPSILLVYQIMRDTGQPETMLWLFLVVKEVFVGAVLGGLIGLPFWGLQGVGDAVDVYRGGSAANLFDPVHAQEMTLAGQFLTMMALVLFVVLGGLEHSVDLLLRSQSAWPAMMLAPPFEFATVKGFAEVALKALTVALVMGAPLLIGLLLVDVTLIFAVRGARSFNVYDLVNSARGLLLILILPAYAILFANHFETHMRDFLGALRGVIASLAG
jgi:type III secretion protein T